ncbi:MAG: RNA polymerase sigma factor [Thermoanaerobaculia bacterium]
MKLGPTRVEARARRLAPLMRLNPISRVHLHRLWYGKSEATPNRMRLIVAAARSLTGLWVTAADLFDLEPDLAILRPNVLLGHVDPARGETRRLSLFSVPRPLRQWRAVMPHQEQEASAAEMLDVLYREHAPLLCATARHRYGIPHEDVRALVHDIFASLLERRPQVDDMRAFLLGAMQNAARHYWRKRRHESPLLDEHQDTADESTSADLERWSTRVSLAAALAQLGPRCRETLRRYYLDEEKPRDIAEHLDTSAAYVMQLLSSCRKRAREIYCRITRATA